ncbi:MAG: hypothetical protein Q9181_000629 [Wetmoreana brouardii]
MQNGLEIVVKETYAKRAADNKETTWVIVAEGTGKNGKAESEASQTKVSATKLEDHDELPSEDKVRTPATSEVVGNATNTLSGNGNDEKMDLHEEIVYDRPEIAQEKLGLKDAQMLDHPSYTDGESQVIMASDGYKDCLAILLTSEMVGKINQIATRSRRLKFVTGNLKRTRQEVTSAQNLMNYKLDALHDTTDPAENARIHEEIDRAEKRRDGAHSCLDALEDEIETLTINLAFSRNQSQEMFENVLMKMNLLEVPDPELAGETVPAAESDYDVEKILGHEERYTERHANEIRDGGERDTIQPELNELLAAREDLEQKRNALITLDEAFEHRQENLAEEKAEYLRCVREGTCHVTQTDFDLMALEDDRELTANLRSAQESFEESFKRAKQLGILDEHDAHYQESIFSEWSGGYAMSMENAMIRSAPTKRIDWWQETVEQSHGGRPWNGTELEPWGSPDLEPVTLEMDDCEVRSVAISDSWSCVDHSRNRKRIDRWREIAGRER